MKRKEEPFDLTQRTIFGLLSHNLFQLPFEPEDGVDWKAVFRESKQQAVAFQVFMDRGRLTRMPEELQQEIQTYLFRRMIKNLQVHAHHTDLHRMLSANGIRYVVLKGAASARYYPDPQSRSMGDVDFYVEKSDFERALALFREAGFDAGELDHICHVVLRKKPMHLEMHHTPAGVPGGQMGQIILGYLSDLREQACLVENKTVTCYCPSDFHHGLIMLMHLQHHLLAEGIGLRHLCDWAVFVNKFRGTEFPELFRKRLKSVGLWRLARILSLCAVRYLGLDEQTWMTERRSDLQAADALMEDILSGGNFGNKDRQRAYEGMFISDRGKNGVADRRLRMAFRSLNRITFAKYPIFRKIPILLPLGWILAFGGYLFRTHKRNRQGSQIHVLSAYQKSAPRIRLYQSLGIYEPES